MTKTLTRTAGRALTRDNLTAADVARFWSKVDVLDDPAACWHWSAARVKGYGKVWVGGRVLKAHRVAYALENGPIEPGLVVRHTCDNPPCVNPAHLLIGTYADNNRDMVERGRARLTGEAHGQAVLTAEQVVAARRRVRDGETVTAVAREYGVNTGTIHAAVYGRTWSSVNDVEPPVVPRRAALTADAVIEARRRVRDGETVTAVAREYGVGRDTLHLAVRGRTWPSLNHIEAPVPAGAARGEAHGRATLTAEQVVAARRRVHAGETAAAVAREYGVVRTTLTNAVYGRNWSSVNHIEPPVPAGGDR